jgi:hypothetical protein
LGRLIFVRSAAWGDLIVFLSINILYLFMKLVWLYSLVQAQVKYDTLKDHWLFLGILYTSALAFLSYIFIFAWQPVSWPAWQQNIAKTVGVSPFVTWVGETLILAVLYFKLLARFDEGALFWVLIIGGLGLVWF